MTAFFAALAAVGAVILYVALLIGQPPKHCRYFVPVKAHPRIYSCSEYPRPVSVP